MDIIPKKVEKINHLVDLNEYEPHQWLEMIDLAHEIMCSPRVYEGSCRGKIMGTLFYESSTRTQMSFQSAMLRLGGGIIGFVNPEATSSVSKGENLKDTIKMVSGYSDIIIIRHPKEGTAKAAAEHSFCSVINAGDGGHLHPTQTLTDLMTLKEEKGRTDNLKIGICGDLKNGRTVHSLVRAMSEFQGNSFYLVSSEKLKLPEYIKKELIAKGCKVIETDSLDKALSEYNLDAMYMTRIQRERFESDYEFKAEEKKFILSGENLKLAPKEMVIMHPLPRVNEIAPEVDEDERAIYFKQANYGMYIRMALILKVLNYDLNGKPMFSGEIYEQMTCRNKKCIKSTETYLKNRFIKEDVYICEYCEERQLPYDDETIAPLIKPCV